jgi:two-component system, cell cycle response regulator DivK
MATVLVIDPDPDSREILEALLRHAGHQVSACSEPAAGIGAAVERRPQAILTELFIRTDTGWAILEFLRSSPDTASIPVIAISGFAMPDDQQRALKSGARRFLAKPVCAQAVVEAIRDVVDARCVA